MNSRKYLEILNGKLNTVGKNIQNARESLNYSRQYVSDRLMNYGIDISAHSLYDIETGSRTVIDYELAAISKVLKTNSNVLLKDFYNYLDNI